MNYVEKKWMELQVMMLMAVTGLKDAVMEKRQGASHFVEILVAIIIVIAIGAIFKDKIVSFINNITTSATSEANNLF